MNKIKFIVLLFLFFSALYSYEVTYETIKKISFISFDIDEKNEAKKLSDKKIAKKISEFIGKDFDEENRENLKKEIFSIYSHNIPCSFNIKEKDDKTEKANLIIDIKFLEENGLESIADSEKKFEVEFFENGKIITNLETNEDLEEYLDNYKISAILLTNDENFENFQNIKIDSFIINKPVLEKKLSKFIGKYINDDILKNLKKEISLAINEQFLGIAKFQVIDRDNSKKIVALIKTQDKCPEKQVNKPVVRENILIDNLNSLIFTSCPQLIPSEELKNYEGIEFDNIEFNHKEHFVKKMSKFLNRPLSLKTLGEIKKESLEYFKKSTPYIVDVKILEKQDITSGKLQILILFAKLDQLTAQGAKYFSSRRMIQNVRMNQDDYINTDKLKSFLQFDNQNPFKNTSIIYEPSDEIGYTNIHLIAKDKFPLRIYSGYDNTGAAVAGQSRYLVGMNIGNFLYLDQQVNVEFKSALSTNKWFGFTGNYIIPLFSKTYVKFIGAFVKTKPNATEDIGLRGKALTFLTRYSIPFKPFKNGAQEFILGYDYKQTNNFLSFQSDAITNTKIVISQFLLKIQGNIQDKKGVNSYELSLYLSPGDMGKNNKDANYRVENYAEKSNYTYFTLRYDRTTFLPRKYLWVVDAFAQISSTKLLPTEAISIGGYNTVRGYQENAAYGDSGFYLKNEIRTKKFKFKKIKRLDGDFQALAFVDMGFVTNLNQNVYSRNSTLLASTGPGIRYTYKDNLRASVDYGVQLKSSDRKFFAKSWHSKFHVILSLIF